jgi:O-antigen/teichoic acid export membrane protein
MSTNYQVVQSKDGDTVPFRNTCHTMQAILGSGSALLLALLARPVATLAGVPEVSWAFSVLAFVPFVHGFVHLDNYVRQRRLEYGPAVLCDIGPQLIITAAAWPLALWLKDFRVILFLELGRMGVTVAVTHLVATNSYRWAWHPGHLRSMLAFGWPLIVSGMLLALSQQADRIVVSRFYTLNEVAEYSLAFSLITVPFLIFAQVASSTMLPVLSRSQDDPARFLRHYRVCMECAALVSAGMTAPIIAMSDRITTLLYGVKYSGAGAVLTVLGAATGFRLLRVATFTAATAMGDTRNQLSSNVGRCLGLGLALLLAMSGTSVLWIAVAAAVGEVIALSISVLRIKRKQGIHAALGLKAALFVGGSAATGICVRCLLPHDTKLFLAGMVMVAQMGALCAAGLLLFGDTSRMAWGSVMGALNRPSKPAAVVS